MSRCFPSSSPTWPSSFCTEIHTSRWYTFCNGSRRPDITLILGFIAFKALYWLSLLVYCRMILLLLFSEIVSQLTVFLRGSLLLMGLDCKALVRLMSGETSSLASRWLDGPRKWFVACTHHCKEWPAWAPWLSQPAPGSHLQAALRR
jgi:hypothetical protein